MALGNVVLPLAAFFLLLGVRRVPENKRLVVHRLDRRLGVLGPGLLWLIPFVDHTLQIDLDKDAPQWRYMTDEQLQKRIEQIEKAAEAGRS